MAAIRAAVPGLPAAIPEATRRRPSGRLSLPGGGGGGSHGGQRDPRQDIADNPKMQPLIYSTVSLNVDLKTPEVDVTDDQFHKLILYLDGRQLQKSTNNNHQEVPRAGMEASLCRMKKVR